MNLGLTTILSYKEIHQPNMFLGYFGSVKFCDSTIYNNSFCTRDFLGHPPHHFPPHSTRIAMNNLPFTTSPISHKQLLCTFSSLPIYTLSYSPSPLSLHFPTLPSRKPRSSISTAQCKGSNSTDAPDRLISAITYFFPFFDGIQYGKYVITQFTPFQTVIQPLVPAIKVFKSFPFNGFLVFLTLYFVVVRNRNFSRYVRFNTMQAIVLDVLLIFPDLLERTFNPREGVGLELMMSLDSTVFLFLLVCLIYGSSSCLFGQVPRLPLVAEAADRQVL